MLDHTHVLDAARRFDPTGTSDIRSRFRGDMATRWRKLRRLTTQAIAKDDLLGLDPFGAQTTQTIARSADPIHEFQSFIDGALLRLFGDGSWTQHYLDEAAARARSRAYKLVPAVGPAQHENAHVVVTSSAAVELQGVMEAVSQQAVRAVSQGLLTKQTPRQIAAAVAAAIRRVGDTRGAALAEISNNSAFNNATLDTLKSLGVSYVTTIPEHTHVRRGGDALDFNPYHDPRTGEFASGAGGAAPASEKKEPRAKTKWGRLRQRLRALERSTLVRGKQLYTLLEVAARIKKENPDWSHDVIYATLLAAHFGSGPYADLLKRYRRSADAVDHAVADRDTRRPGSRLKGRAPSRATYFRIKQRERELEKLGEVEVLTAGDDDVCLICRDISKRGPYKIDAARGLIPAHPNCRCAFVPASDERFAEVEKDSASDAGPPDEPRDPHGRWTGGGGSIVPVRTQLLLPKPPRKIEVFGKGQGREAMRQAVGSLPENHWLMVADVVFIAIEALGQALLAGRALGRYSPGQPGNPRTITVADTYKTKDGRRKNPDVTGVTYHEIGHAIDDVKALSPLFKLGGVLERDAERLSPAEKYLAYYWLTHGPRELFAETYKLTYSPAQKGAFGGGQKRMEHVFARSIDAIKKELGERSSDAGPSDEPRDRYGKWTTGGAGGAHTGLSGGYVARRSVPKVGGGGAGKGEVQRALRSLLPDHLRVMADVAFFAVSLIDTARTLGLFEILDKRTGQVSPKITVADRYRTGFGTRKNRDVVGTAYHEIGHAIDLRLGMSSELLPLAKQMRSDAARMTDDEKYVARYYLAKPSRELFPEIYKLAYSPEKKGAFGGEQQRMEQVFTPSIEMMRKMLGERLSRPRKDTWQR